MFVINCALIAPKNLVSVELIHGRAIAIMFNWHETEELLLINVYAPNGKQEQIKFWEDLDTSRRAKGLRRPDFLLGDFNVTEDAIDRAPAHLDDINTIKVLRNLRQCLGLKDAWRHVFPNERNFTYRANNNGQQIKSRIDRIYSSDTAAKSSFDWKLKQMSVPTDHWMVQVKYTPTKVPFIGKGRWTWQLPELKNGELMEKIQVRGIKLQRDLKKIVKELTPHEAENPQSLWAGFKSYLRDTGKKHCKGTRGKLTKKIEKLEKEIKTLSDNPELDMADNIRVDEAYLAKELEILEHIWERDRKDDTRAAISNHGEVLGGIWSAMNRDRKPRDLIYRMKVPDANPTTYERDSRRMTNLARDYHESLQNQDTHPAEDAGEYCRKMNGILNEIPDNQRMSDIDRRKTDWSLDYTQIMLALKLSKNGTATGLYGCPYELWKELNTLYDIVEKEGNLGFDIIAVLAEVFKDIRKHGIDKRLDLAHGWMCPIYKKKDPMEISNYSR